MVCPDHVFVMISFVAWLDATVWTYQFISLLDILIGRFMFSTLKLQNFVLAADS